MSDHSAPTQSGALPSVPLQPVVRHLNDPCTGGKTHRWRTLYEPPCNLPVRWCQRCGKRVNPNHKPNPTLHRGEPTNQGENHGNQL